MTSANLEDRRGYLTLVVTAQREGKLLLRKTEGIREWQQAVSGLLGGGEKGGMATTREFWSRRQFSDCQGAQEWLLARQRTGTHRSSDEPPSRQLSVTLRLSPPAHIFSPCPTPPRHIPLPYLCPLSTLLISVLQSSYFPNRFPLVSCPPPSLPSPLVFCLVALKPQRGLGIQRFLRESEIGFLSTGIQAGGHQSANIFSSSLFVPFNLTTRPLTKHTPHTHTPNPAPFMLFHCLLRDCDKHVKEHV